MDALLEQLAETVSGAEDLESLTRPLLELLETVTGMDSTYLTRVDEAAGQQHIVFARNSRTMQIPEGLSVPWDDTLCKRALEENRPYTDDVTACWGDSQAARDLGIKTYLSQPVRYSDGALFGTLCAASGSSVPLGAASQKVLGMFARILTLQVDRERRLAQLRQTNAELSGQAMTDALTGLPNRRALMEALERTLARAARDGAAVQVAFIDLDGFKAINDRHGHEAGDRFLRSVGQRLGGSTRTSEIAGRYGGDEFVLVAEGARGDDLQRRLQGVIAGQYDLGASVLHYPGASIGVVTAEAGETPEALLKRADAAMYADKSARKAGH